MRSVTIGTRTEKETPIRNHIQQNISERTNLPRFPILETVLLGTCVCPSTIRLSRSLTGEDEQVTWSVGLLPSCNQQTPMSIEALSSVAAALPAFVLFTIACPSLRAKRTHCLQSSHPYLLGILAAIK